MDDSEELAMGRGHPRPLLRRPWTCLNGTWDFADDSEGRWEHPREVKWSGSIIVPFAPETSASGVGETGFRQACWYRRPLELAPVEEGERVLVHFGAVDYAASVWIDGQWLARHEGGYSAFDVNVTPFCDGLPHELVVQAQDDPLDLAKPRGKQDWELEPHNVWYPRTTGIWQTVWLERLPRIAVTGLQWTSDLDRYEVATDVRLGGALEAGARLRIRLAYGERCLVDDVSAIHGTRLGRSFRLDVTGLDFLRDELTWSPDHPALIDAVLEILDAEGTVLDRVQSYAAMRTVAVRAGRFLLNGRPYPLRLVLDQGYWPETGLTAPDDDALRRDVELAQAMGFNGVRKHQKIEDPRYLWWADRLGLLVWAEMPPAYRFDNEAVPRLVREWTDAIERDRSHPCIVAWVPFNESTGTLSLPARPEQRHYVEAVALLTKALDPARLVLANDGWEGLGGDLIGIHDYDQDPDRLAARYEAGSLAAALGGFGDGGRMQLLDALERPVVDIASSGPRAVVLTEFGGIGFAEDAPILWRHGAVLPDAPDDRLNQPAAWGYSTVASADELIERYGALLRAVHSVETLAGFCYTQFADTYQEVNGLLRADRRPKASLQAIAEATLGPGRRPDWAKESARSQPPEA